MAHAQTPALGLLQVVEVHHQEEVEAAQLREIAEIAVNCNVGGVLVEHAKVHVKKDVMVAVWLPVH